MQIFFIILVQYPRNWRKHLCVCVQLLKNLQKKAVDRKVLPKHVTVLNWDDKVTAQCDGSP